MSTIKSQLIKGVNINSKDPATGLYNAKIPVSIITAAVNTSGTVLVSFRQSDSGSGWMTLPFALPNNYWVFSYGVDFVTITNTNGNMPNGVDFLVVAIAV